MLIFSSCSSCKEPCHHQPGPNVKIIIVHHAQHSQTWDSLQKQSGLYLVPVCFPHVHVKTPPLISFFNILSPFGQAVLPSLQHQPYLSPSTSNKTPDTCMKAVASLLGQDPKQLLSSQSVVLQEISIKIINMSVKCRKHFFKQLASSELRKLAMHSLLSPDFSCKLHS